MAAAAGGSGLQRLTVDGEHPVAAASSLRAQHRNVPGLLTATPSALQAAFFLHKCYCKAAVLLKHHCHFQA